MGIVVAKHIGFACVLFVLGTAPCIAEVIYSDAFKRCMDRDPQPSIAQQVSGCYDEENDRDEKRLNQLYNTLRTKMPAYRASMLIDGERAWLIFRNKWCNFTETSDHPPSREANKSMCISEVTKSHIDRIDDLLK